MAFDPPKYEWVALSADEAMEYLEVARVLIDAHMRTLEPVDAMSRRVIRREVPVSLVIGLDLGGAVRMIQGRQAEDMAALEVESVFSRADEQEITRQTMRPPDEEL